ncbi:hypothetical protein C4D60_Mb06t33640 [Musa balbisiana]|uniref:Uncharacterized protein n=1 Tax=Musa balbisiana TaxID=52838 RepID=A0A4S8ISL3_MUSBA|nr:hypothetical protein C4D60_Mb06t33640 [Musa balbisiana]
MLLMMRRMITRSGMNAGTCRRSRYLFDEMLEITYSVFVHAKYQVILHGMMVSMMMTKTLT